MNEHKNFIKMSKKSKKRQKWPFFEMPYNEGVPLPKCPGPWGNVGALRAILSKFDPKKAKKFNGKNWLKMAFFWLFYEKNIFL